MKVGEEKIVKFIAGVVPWLWTNDIGGGGAYYVPGCRISRSDLPVVVVVRFTGPHVDNNSIPLWEVVTDDDDEKAN